VLSLLSLFTISVVFGLNIKVTHAATRIGDAFGVRTKLPESVVSPLFCTMKAP